jgi:hypothetical protein
MDWPMAARSPDKATKEIRGLVAQLFVVGHVIHEVATRHPGEFVRALSNRMA